MSFRQIKNVRLYEGVVSQVIELIESRQLEPGHQLPPERKLAETIGVSRNVLREAFHVLEEQGIILTRPGGGRYVRPDNIQHKIDTRGLIFRLEQATILDILESREILECQAVVLAADRIRPDEIELLQSAAMQTNTWEDNTNFHIALASTTHNFMLERLVRLQLDLLRATHQRDHYTAPSNAKKLLEDHREIANAVIDRNAESAQQLLHDHLEHARLMMGLEEHQAMIDHVEKVG